MELFHIGFLKFTVVDLIDVALVAFLFYRALILMKGVAPPGIQTRDIWKSVPPFVAIQLLVMVITLIFPQLALWLPEKMF